VQDAAVADARTCVLNQSFAFMWVLICEDAPVLVRQISLAVSSAGCGTYDQARSLLPAAHLSRACMHARPHPDALAPPP
jgi:hypothetical protein